MNEEKRCEIERLAAEAHEKLLHYKRLGMMNTPSEPEAQEAAAVEYALARREMIKAHWALEYALNS